MPDVLVPADRWQRRSRAGSRWWCRSRARRSDRKPGRPAREPGRAADSAVHRGPSRGRNDRWPLQDFLELGALAGALPCARLHARQVLWEWGIGNLGDSIELLVTELITNAVRASGEMTQVYTVRLWPLSDSAHILILV